MKLEQIATVIFGLAVVHTFCVSYFRKIAHKYPEGSKGENFFHLLGETEAVFIMWAGVLWLAYAVYASVHHIHDQPFSFAELFTGFGHGWHEAIEYIESLNYTEPKFVFCIMVVAATKPVIDVVDQLIRLVAHCIPMRSTSAFLLSALVVGPQLGSFITEPAAMTVTALVLKRQFFTQDISRTLKYLLLGTLFVNVSIGGVWTPFAAPPVLMVAGQWGWDFAYMAAAFGWKAGIAVIINATMVTWYGISELKFIELRKDSDKHDADAAQMPQAPGWVTAIHLAVLALIVATAHHPDVFFGVFIFFLGFCVVTQEYQETMKVKESLLVGGFLAGLVTLGGLQSWWLEPLIASLNEVQLYIGATGLTAITDNAALTYLGSQVESLAPEMKYALVAGAVSGGGLTVIANAPNPAGYAILNSAFENGSKGGINPFKLLLAALPPTLVAMGCLWFLPTL